MFFKQIVMLHLLFVALWSFGNFAGDIEVKNLDVALGGVGNKKLESSATLLLNMRVWSVED